MNTGATNTRDKGVVDAYRAASDALDERPRAQSRAEILAAAARAADAQPQDAATGATSRRFRARERANPIGPSRRPLALVASFLVATVAIVIATQTGEQPDTPAPGQVAEAPASPAPMASADLEAKREADGQFPAGPMKDQGAGAAGERPPLVPPPEIQVQTPAMRSQAPQSAAPPAKPAAEETPARNERALADSSVVTKSAGKAQVGRVASAEAPVVAALPPPPEPPVTSATPPPAAPPAAQEQRAKEDVSRLARVAPRTDPRAAGGVDAASSGKLAKARPVERTAALAEGTAELENDPARWMERIVALREAGRDDDADRELARLRERYPDTKVPPEALRRTGTR